MTQQMTSGKVLRQTRERKGYDLTTVARRLRIRPDILRAIEAGDYAAMPPRGYTRNMVNAYARLLGLNPTEIVNMYLDEAYAVQVERARGSAPSSGFNMERESRLKRSRSRSSRSDEQSGRGQGYGYDGDRGSSRSDGRYGRTLYDDRTKFSRDDYGVTRERMDRPGKSDRDFLSHHSGYTSTNFGFLDSQGGGGRTVHVGQTPMQYSASRVPGFLQSRVAMAAVIGLIIIIILVVVFVVLGNKNAPSNDDVSSLPVSGINDTTGTAEDEEVTPKVEVAPTSARVVATVKAGQEAYIDYRYEDNGEWSEEHLVGPTERTFEITGKFTIATWTPDTLTVTVDGVPVQLTNDDSIGGLSAYTVDFPAILEQWRSTHTSREAQRSSAVATAEAGATSASSASAQSASSQGGTS